MNNEIRNTLLDILMPQQKSWLETAHHIFYGARRTGRTYMLCVLALLEAINYPNMEFPIYNHDPNTFRGDAYLSETLGYILANTKLVGKFEVKHKYTQHTITVKYIDAVELDEVDKERLYWRLHNE
jgi:hypothetical protein